MSKTIAILVPSYNSVGTLEGTLRSILALRDELDRHVDFVMLSDDGSKDETVALAKRVWDHPSVPLKVKQAAKNGGEYRNVNGAFAAMPDHIEWVLIMHADNEALPGWIDVLARECLSADRRSASVCGSWKYLVDGVTTDEGDTRGPTYVEHIQGDDAAVRSTLFKGCWWHNSTAAIRVAAWKEVGGHPQETPLLGVLGMLGLEQTTLPLTRKLRIKGDWDVLLRLLSSGWSIVYVGTPLIRYLELSSSVSAGSFAWHGDLLETLQVTRRHQAVLSQGDIALCHWRCIRTLLRRLAGAVLRGNWRRAGFAIQAFPVMLVSLAFSSLNRARGEGGVLKSIPYGADLSPP
jgi:glycosyltransferase involved in cell wall biosynthesis